MLNADQRRFRLRLGFLLLFLFPAAWILKFFSPGIPVSVCLFKTITGKPCPFCGLTRAFSQALHGEFQKAFDFHPLWWLAVLLILCSIIILLYEGFTGNDRISVRLRPVQNFSWIFIFFAVITLIVRCF